MAAVATETQYRVLAVDDNLLDRKLIERLLKTSSYHVTTVDSGSKALQFLGLQDEQSNSPSVSSDQHDINLVITDYSMPEMTGYDLLKKIKESSSLKDIPVVIMSSENVPSRINRRQLEPFCKLEHICSWKNETKHQKLWTRLESLVNPTST